MKSSISQAYLQNNKKSIIHWASLTNTITIISSKIRSNSEKKIIQKQNKMKYANYAQTFEIHSQKKNCFLFNESRAFLFEISKKYRLVIVLVTSILTSSSTPSPTSTRSFWCHSHSTSKTYSKYITIPIHIVYSIHVRKINYIFVYSTHTHTTYEYKLK